jgi:hypothetical protein
MVVPDLANKDIRMLIPANAKGKGISCYLDIFIVRLFKNPILVTVTSVIMFLENGSSGLSFKI